MVLSTLGAAYVARSGGKAAAAGAGVGIGAGFGAIALTGSGTSASAAIGSALGGAASAGAIAGEIACEGGALIGALTGALSGTGVSSSGIVALVGSTAGWALIPIGTSVDSKEDQITYDCWKPVVHDTSVEPSDGMLLKDIICHPHVTDVTMTPGVWPELPNIVLRNTWNESFEIEYVLLHDTRKIVGHAKRVCA